jgi:hypothetical protein
MTWNNRNVCRVTFLEVQRASRLQTAVTTVEVLATLEQASGHCFLSLEAP